MNYLTSFKNMILLLLVKETEERKSEVTISEMTAHLPTLLIP